MSESDGRPNPTPTSEDRVPDLGVAQILALAEAANVHLEMVDGRLVMRSSAIDWKLWPVLRQFLAEIGAEAIARYFENTTAEDRLRLAAVPARPGPRAISHRFSMY